MVSFQLLIRVNSIIKRSVLKGAVSVLLSPQAGLFRPFVCSDGFVNDRKYK